MDLNPPFPVLPGQGQYVSPEDNPGVLAATQQVLANAIRSTPMTPPEPNIVRLPGGVSVNGQWITEARVRELNGADEEAIGRAAVSGLPEKIPDAILSCGVISLGDNPVTPALLDDMIIGDREALILGIRRVTYGKTIDFDPLTCRDCGTQMVVKYDLADIPVKQLDAETNEFEVTLRDGRIATVRLATGGDQKAVMTASRAKELSTPEQQTILLARTVLRITSADGTQQTAFGTRQAQMMGAADRHAILRELSERKIGPDHDQALINCTGCGEKVEVPVNIDTLFRD
ncbi:hypothetical protein [Microbispora sp. NPDC049633]|uniref:T4 family baseplate hub assembly chaperone n=1 Tax=Microbispora sp. NPDC049633 TaxID=3154355 RepID=UPI0034199766